MTSMSNCGSLLDRLRDVLHPEFTVERPLGGGGMGCVFLGRDVKLDRLVAIKVLRPEMASAALTERFLREARSLAKLSNPHIMPIHFVNEKGGLSYYVMDYLGDTATLADRLKQGPLPRSEWLKLARDLLEGLAASHRLGIVHRDVKPANIFLVSGRGVLGDFGIASSRDEEGEALTEPGPGPGTPGYQSPEQVSGGPVDGRSDLYVVGIVLHEAATGLRWPAFQDPLKGDWKGIKRGDRKVLGQALQLEPAARWQDAEAFRLALTRLGERRFQLALAAMALCVLTVVAWKVVQSVVEHYRRAPHTDLAVLPFRASAEGVGINGEEFSRDVQSNLKWFGRLRLTPPAVTAQKLGRAASGHPSSAELKRLNAQYAVTGKFVRQGDHWVLRMTALDSTAEEPFVIDVSGSPERVIDWSGAASDSLVHQVFPEQWNYYRSLRTHPSSSQQAYHEFFRGDSAFQRDAYNTAETLYVKALAADSNFVFASWQLGLVYRFLRQPFEGHLRRLYQVHGAELPPQYRELIEAMLDPDLRSRFARYRRTVAEFPLDGLVRFVYADELFHRGALAGFPLDSALAQFHKAVEIEPFLDQMPAWDHIFYGNMRLGYRPEADAALDRRVSIPPSGEEEDVQRRKFFKLAYDDRFQPWLGALKRRGFEIIASGKTLERVNRFVRLGSSFDIPTSQASLGRILIRKGRTVHERANGYHGLGLALLAMGRPIAAMRALDSGAVLFGGPDSLLERAEWRVLLPVYFEAPVVSDSDRSWATSTLTALAAGPPGPVASRAAWALAVGANAQGDTGATTRLAASLADPSTRHLSRLLGALQQSARGRPDSALALTESLLAYDTAGAVIDPFARSVLYLNRVRWFLATGDSAAADRSRLWYQNSDSGIDGWPQGALESGDIDGMLGVQARLVQAEFDLDRGRRDTACPLARRVKELWRDAEDTFEPFRQRADHVLERCRQ
jgi:serine/threonine protein kinase